MVKTINIEGRKIEYFIEGTGKKVVAIMVGMGCNLYDWLDIVHEISKSCRVIVIHRPGIGNSKLHKNGSTTEIASKDMYNLLKELNIEEKIILVGHSYGGLCVQHFARLYPEVVEGIVLVESASMEAYKYSELELPVINETDSDEEYIRIWTQYSQCTKEQLMEEIKPTLSSKQLLLPMDIQKELLEINVRPEIYINQLSEILDLRNNVQNIKNVGEFPSIPLKILVRDAEYSINEWIQEGAPKIEAERLENLNLSLQKDLKKLSPFNELKIIEKSNHCINETRPDAIIETIKELLL